MFERCTLFELHDTVNCNRGLPGQSVEKVEPFLIRFEPGTLEDLQHSHDLPFGNQRHSIVNVIKLRITIVQS